MIGLIVAVIVAILVIGLVLKLIKFAVIVVATLPILIFYPFLQKHFAKGMLIGSVKG